MTENTTMLGYHNKDHDKYGVLNAKSPPIFVEEKYSPFLITRDYIFTISTSQIIRLINNYKTLSTFRILKVTASNILLIPGIIVAIGYILEITQILKKSIIPSNLMHFVFWLAVLGIIILWHDHYRTKSHPIKFPEAEEIPTKERNSIKDYGIKFERYISLESIHFLSEDSLRILAKQIQKNNFNSLELFKEIISEPFTKEVLNRSELNKLNEKLHELDIGEHTLPQYNITGIRNLVIYANQAAIKTKSDDINPCHFLIAFFKTFPVLQKILSTKKLSIEILEEAVRFLTEEKYKRKSSNYFNIHQPYYKNGGIAKDLVFGWTYILEHFTSNINLKVSNTKEIFGIGHEQEVDALTSTISKMTKNNALLIGQPGAGKSSLILGLAQRINRGEVPPQLLNKKIVQLNLNGLIALASKEKKMEQLVESAMTELNNAGNTILYIDEIHELIPAKSGESGHSIASMMLPHIIDSKFPIVGTINYSDYKKHFYSNQSLQNSFENIEVEELSPEATLEILSAKLPLWEANYQLYIPIPTLTSAVELAQRYVANRKLPDSAVSIMESTCAWAQNNNIKRINNEHVAKSVSIQHGIPVTSIDADEATKLMQLEEKIKSRIIGQNEAVHLIVETLKRARADIRDPNKPIGVFLFLGPTGVGKTYLARVVAQEYFDRGEDIIRVDMSEYQEISSVAKFLDTGGETSSGQNVVSLIDRIKRNPYSVVLFDEIEKAHPNVLNIFLQLFDEGRLTSNAGETVSFKNSIIITTSNIGSRMILDTLAQDDSLWSQAKDKAMIELKQAISPELFNRFDEIVVFSPHDINNLTKITELELQQLANRLKSQGISVIWNDTIPMLIANKAYEPGLGARPIRRFLQRNIEGKVATEIISQNVKSGEEINIKESWLND